MSVKALLKPGATTLAVMTKTTLVTAALAALMIPWAAQALDPSLPAYRPLETLSGHLKSVGSDTLGHEMEAWAKGFEKLYPDVKVEIEAAGSATAPLALLEGRSQFGPMSRPMTAEETAAFQDKYGYKISRLPRRGRCFGGLREQGQSRCLPDTSAIERDLLVQSQDARHQRCQDLGRPRTDQRMGAATDHALHPKYVVWNV